MSDPLQPARGARVGFDLAIFDFDGTLADSFPLFLALSNQLADRHGFRRIDEGELDHLRGLGARELMTRLQLPLWKAPRVAADFRALMERRAEPLPLFAGVPAMLARLIDGGLRLALLSSNSAAVVERALGAEAARFDRCDCGVSMFGKGARLRRLARTCGVAPGRAIYIGDELRDGEAAREAGLAFGAVAWGYTRPDALAAAGADRLFAQLGDVAAALT